MDSMEISDEDLNKFVNVALSEQLIRNGEDHLLQIYKYRQEKYPSGKNEREWLYFTNYVCRRRKQSGID
jgi:hypothetical protein